MQGPGSLLAKHSSQLDLSFPICMMGPEVQCEGSTQEEGVQGSPSVLCSLPTISPSVTG